MNPNNESYSMNSGKLVVADDGWCDAILRQPSPNHDARPAGTDIDLLVIHNISLPPGEFGGQYVDALFQNRLDYAAHPYFEQLQNLRVSAHFFIDRHGIATQFVSTLNRAWHAGVSRLNERERCNDFSIGIEMEGTDFIPFEEPQYQTLALLTQALLQRHPLTTVVGHEHIAPERKTDPGPFFNWQYFRQIVEKNTQLSPIQRQLCFPFLA